MSKITLKGPGSQTVVLDVDEEDLIGKRILKSKNWYEYPLLQDIYNRTKDLSGSAFDIGAHIGNHSLWLSKCCGLEVVALEPQPDSYDRLTKNVMHNKANVFPMAYGAGASNGWGITLPHKEGNSGTSAFQYTNKGNIPTRSIDSFNLKDVVVIKIDVEEHRVPGSLKSIFEGAQQTIEHSNPIIYAEGDKDLIKSCLPQNYVCFGVFGKTATYGFEAKG